MLSLTVKLKCERPLIHRGFTLVELMVGISIVAILALIAVPQYASLVASKQIEIAANDFMSGFSLTREKSAVLGGGVVICAKAAADQPTCSTGAPWSNGWLIFHDLNGDRQRNEAENIFYDYPGFEQDITIEAVNGTIPSVVSFNELGRADLGSLTSLRFCDSSSSTPRTITLVLSIAGRGAVTEPNGIGGCTPPE